MGGGLLQLVAYGAQDVYLTGNPQITFFKVVYRRHTNFAIEAIEQSFNGNNNLGSSVSVLITRNGDLINRIYYNAKIKNNAAAGGITTDGITLSSAGDSYAINDVLFLDAPTGGGTAAKLTVTKIALEAATGPIEKFTVELAGSGYTVSATAEIGVDTTNSGTTGSGSGATFKVSSLLSHNLVPYFGQRLLKTIELEIGGQKIDKHYSEWLYIWNELSMPVGKKDGYMTMVGGNATNSAVPLKGGESYEITVPLEFWFCRNVGLALPLIALQYHEVKINISYANDKDIAVVSGEASNFKLQDAGLWVDYIFLDTDERRRFAQLSHEYLIEQLQFTGTDNIEAGSSSMKSVRMTFNHPCKELLWVIRGNETGGKSPHWNNFTDEVDNDKRIIGKNPVTKAKMQLNGNDRFAERDGTYFSVVQPYQHHECTPSVYNGGINVYSFALKPEEHQPSGTLNMSRIDTAVLSVQSNIAGTIYIYAVNYNVLRILSGMGGLAYSN